MIWYTRRRQPASTTSVLTVFYVFFSPSASSKWSLLLYRISTVPTLLWLNLRRKSTGNITRSCCWCRNCCQWSAALLETCLSSGKTMQCTSATRSWYGRASVLQDTPVHQASHVARQQSWLNVVAYVSEAWCRSVNVKYQSGMELSYGDGLLRQAEYEQNVVNGATDQCRETLEACVDTDNNRVQKFL